MRIHNLPLSSLTVKEKVMDKKWAPISKSHRSSRYLKHAHASVSSMYTDESGKKIYPRQAWILERIKWNEVRESERKRETQENCSDSPRQNVCVSIVVKWGESQATYFNIFKLEKKGLGWSQGNFFVFVCHRITIISTEVTHGCCEYKKTMCLSATLPSPFLMSVQWESEEN